MSREFEVPEYDQIPGDSWGVPREILDRPEQFETQVPLLRRTLNFVRQYEISKTKGREALCSQLADFVLREPIALVYVLSNLDLINQVRSQKLSPELEEQIITSTEQAASQRTNLSLWTPQRIEQLVQLNLDSPTRLAQVIQRVEAALFSAPRTMEESVELHYNTAWAMVVTLRPEIKEEIFAILCYEKDWFPPQSFSAQCFAIGVSAASDQYLGRFHAVMDALDQVGIFQETNLTGEDQIDSMRSWNRVFRIRQASNLLSQEEKDRLSMLARRQAQRNPEKTRKLIEIHSREEYVPPGQNLAGDNYLETALKLQNHLERISHLPWPENIIHDFNEPLRRMLFESFGPQVFRAGWENYRIRLAGRGYERLTERTVQFTDDFIVDIIASGCTSQEQRISIIREVCETLRTGKCPNPLRQLNVPMDKVLEVARMSWVSFGFREVFDSDQNIMFAIWRSMSEAQLGKLASIIEYHRPPISLEQAWKISKELTDLRQDIKRQFVRSVDRRGYELVISDPMLRQLGYRYLLFNQEAGSDRIKVRIGIDDISYEISLDREHRIVPGDDFKSVISVQDQLWLELLVLSHLKKIICTAENDVEEELVGREKQVKLYRRQVIGRGEHLRRLPPGQQYSQEAFLRCLKSNLQDRNLHQINKDRGCTKETGLWTYVSPVGVVDTPTTKPIKIAFANATEDLRKVVNLGKISDEELARIEREILGELEKES